MIKFDKWLSIYLSAARCPVGWVNIHGGGRCIVGKEEAHGLSDAEDMGWFPVGRECAKKVVGYVEEEPGE